MASPDVANPCYQLSTHAELRTLERTSISGGQLLERLTKNACVWLNWKTQSRESNRFALLYCPAVEEYFVAIVATNGTVKTVLTLEQRESQLDEPVSAALLALAKQATAQELAMELLAPRYVQILVKKHHINIEEFVRIGSFSPEELEPYNLPYGSFRKRLKSSKQLANYTHAFLERFPFATWLPQAYREHPQVFDHAEGCYLAIGRLSAELGALAKQDITAATIRLLHAAR